MSNQSDGGMNNNNEMGGGGSTSYDDLEARLNALKKY